MIKPSINGRLTVYIHSASASGLRNSGRFGSLYSWSNQGPVELDSSLIAELPSTYMFGNEKSISNSVVKQLVLKVRFGRPGEGCHRGSGDRCEVQVWRKWAPGLRRLISPQCLSQSDTNPGRQNKAGRKSPGSSKRIVKNNLVSCKLIAPQMSSTMNRWMQRRETDDIPNVVFWRCMPRN